MQRPFYCALWEFYHLPGWFTASIKEEEVLLQDLDLVGVPMVEDVLMNLWDCYSHEWMTSSSSLHGYAWPSQNPYTSPCLTSSVFIPSLNTHKVLCSHYSTFSYPSPAPRTLHIHPPISLSNHHIHFIPACTWTTRAWPPHLIPFSILTYPSSHPSSHTSYLTEFVTHIPNHHAHYSLVMPMRHGPHSEIEIPHRTIHPALNWWYLLVRIPIRKLQVIWA